MGIETSSLLISPPATVQWKFVRKRFNCLQGNLSLKEAEKIDGITKVNGIVSSLNRHFRDDSLTDHYFIVGSWAKNTAIRPPNDIDIFFIPPNEVFHQFEGRSGNKQSQLLQHIKDVLLNTYPQTIIRGDGQVVMVGFNTIMIEVIPAFPTQAGGYLICDTNNGGRWKNIYPSSEFAVLKQANILQNGNVCKLSKIMKQWVRHCNVPIKSFYIEQIVKEALSRIDYSQEGEFWFDWMVRDCFKIMIKQENKGFFVEGPNLEWINYGDQWLSKATKAYKIACKACEYEKNNMNLLAGLEWQKIFGTMIPSQIA